MDAGGRPGSSGGEPKRQKRLSCSPAHAMDLVRRTQSGEVRAEHELHRILAPKLRAVLARYRADPVVAEDLDGVGYLLLHDCIIRFDETRGVNFFTFLNDTLPGQVWSYVRGERRDSGRCQSSGTPRDSGDDPYVSADPDEAFEATIRKERGWLEQSSSLEEVVVLRCAIAGAVKTLPRRQRQAYALWAAGRSVKEIATALNMKEKNCYAALERMCANLRRALQRDL